MPRIPRGGAVALALTGALTAAALVTTSSANADASHSEASVTGLGPTVTHTGRGPTGYQVTFRIKDASAASMRIKGTWSFASTASSSTDPTNASPIAAADWKPGDFPLQSPDQPGEAWAVASMTKDTATGVWSYTVPLPSGTFDYQFYADCASDTLSGCTSRTDPANPAWNTTGSAAVFSQVYVPSDRAYGTADLSYTADAPAGRRGKLAEVTYPTANSTTGTNRLAVYTPPGYNPKRSTPYPVFVLSHGGGENEIAWTTRGRLQQIVDNLIAAGRMQPAVVVMPNGSGISMGSYTTEITGTVLQYVEQHYDVGTDAADRAFAGTSAYGTQANNFLFKDTTAFGYYGVWSPASGAPAVTVTGSGNTPIDDAYKGADLKKLLGVHLAIGQEDLGGNAPMMTATTEREGLINAGVPFTYYSVGGGHTWAFWQQTLYDFLTRVGFRATSTAMTAGSTKLTAEVTAVSTEPATPTGTVQFKADGVDLGRPVRLSGGKAVLTGKSSSWTGKTVTAVYSGDTLYNGSAG
ncbi:alpha/beta hydrolase-fold protein [Streptomyces sp. NPDC047081]|uniref:alpha/beta hydrolase-fold protein n=1 Tax=Streptomyces sp. NPDC047081 TaxID=3154706 RepID=UPI0033F3B5EE